MQNYNTNKGINNPTEFKLHDESENHDDYNHDYVLTSQASKNIRVLQRNTIYIIGIKEKLANSSI